MTITEAKRVATLRAQRTGLAQAIVLDPRLKRSYNVLTENTARVNGMTIVDTVKPVELDPDIHAERERRHREYERAEDELKAQTDYLSGGVRKLSGIDR